MNIKIIIQNNDGNIIGFSETNSIDDAIGELGIFERRNREYIESELEKEFEELPF